MLGLPVHICAHFRERSGPSILHRLHESATLVRTVWDKIEANYGNHEWRHSDEENFADLVSRVQMGLKHVEKLPEEHIAIFSHGFTMKMVFAYVLLGERLDGQIFQENFLPAKSIANTGVLHLQYTDHPRKQQKYWKLISWNDHAHLT